MRELVLHALTVFMGFFAISNPLANAPAFLGLTQGDSPATTRAVARRAVLLAFCIVMVFAIAGKVIFDLFGITLDAFRITGGLLVMVIGFEMLKGAQSDVQQPQDTDPAQREQAALGLAVTPLAMPLIAGPGTIATAMNFTAGETIAEAGITIAGFALNCLLTYLVFIRASRIVVFLGQEALGVITKMMGLLIAVIGTQMIIQGLIGAFGRLG